MNDELITFLNQLKNEIKSDMESQRQAIVSDIETCLQTKVEKLEDRINNIERDLRKKNLILFGVFDEFPTYTRLEEFLCLFLNEKLDLELSINDFDAVRRLGKIIENKSRPILFTMVTFRSKLNILNNVRKLKGSNYSVSEDYPSHVLEKRKLLLPQMKEARRNGKFAVIRYDKLIIKDNISSAKNNLASINANNKRLLSHSPQEKLSRKSDHDAETAKKSKSKSDLQKPKLNLEQFSFSPRAAAVPSSGTVNEQLNKHKTVSNDVGSEEDHP